MVDMSFVNDVTYNKIIPYVIDTSKALGAHLFTVYSVDDSCIFELYGKR